MHEASLTSAATVVIVVHGVGDHSRERILQQAKQGLQCQSGDAVQTMEVTIGGLPSIANESGHAPGMQFKIGSDTHYLVPVVWSRLRPRAANEAEMEERYPRSSFRVFDRLFQPLFYLFPSSLNTIRCIPVTKGILRRALALILAVCYAVVVPIARLSVVFFLSYLWVHRTELDKEHYLWWRILILLAIFWLLDWLVQKVNVVLDYVGDVVGYVGNQRHRQAAEERTLDVMRTVSKLAPQAQIVVAGHSLGSVLITHCVLRLEDGESLSRRLHILTMGSPLRVMSRFFPGKISTPEQILKEYERRNLVQSWVNLWRDADFIGRDLKMQNGGKFGETSLGDGPHRDYWADPRSWQVSINYLRAIAERSWCDLVAGWKDMPLSSKDGFELYIVRKIRTQITCLQWMIVLAILIGLEYFFRVRAWFSSLGAVDLLLVILVCGLIWVPLVLWYVWSTHPPGLSPASPRESLARYRFRWHVATMFRKVAFANGLLAVLGFVLWRLLEASPKP